MKLKVKDAKIILNSLLQLDGYEAVVKIDGNDRIIKKPYDLSGKTRWNIIKDISILERKMLDFEKLRNQLILEISEGKGGIMENEKDKLQKFSDKITPVLMEEEEVDGLLKLTRADLKLDSESDINPFPNGVIKPLIDLGFIE
jgi:hypothetical protein